MGRFAVFVSLLAFISVACAMPVWEYGEDAELVPSSLEISRRRCSCSNHHHQCGCCLQVKAHASHKSIEADVCMNSSFVPDPLAVEFFMIWNKRKVFNHTVSNTHPRPMCFDIPGLKHGKACVKLSKMSIKKGHTGGCAALEFKTRHRGRDLPLGCFFFRGREGEEMDMGTFLDSESLMSLLKDLFQTSMGDQIETTRWLADPIEEELDGDVTEVVTADKASCHCSKSPPQCDCCAKFKIFKFGVKACVHADIEPSGQGFNVAMVINGHTVFKKHIAVPDPPPICHTFHFSPLIKADVCLKLTNVSLKPGHAGACLELDINSIKLSLGCFYMATYKGIE